MKFSTAVAAGLLPILKRKVFFFWLGGIFIDVDHYLWYVIHKRDLNLWRAYQYFHQMHGLHSDKIKGTRPILILHSIEVLLAIGLLAFRWSWSTALLLGMLFHLVLDIITDWRMNHGFDREYSLIKAIIRLRSGR